MDFDSYAKLWPHQLDLLSGPLLEDDDDDDNQIDSELVSVKSTNSLSENSTNGDFPDSFESDDLTDVVCDKLRPPSKNAVHRFYVSGKNSFSPIKKAGLGMLVYVGRKHTARTDSDEEVDIETVEEDLKLSPVKKGALSYRAFSRQVLSVLEDKEILHEVPNVIFANDAEKDTALGNSSFENTVCASSCENGTGVNTNCNAKVKEERKTPIRKSLPYRDFSREVLSVTEDKEILQDVPNLIFASDTEQDTTVSSSSCENTKNTEIKCSTAVLQANDVDSLLEQFEASEGITSQDLAKPTSSLLEDNVIPVGDVSNKSLPEKNISPIRKKDISPYIIQKIKMSSAVKKGPILIPPSHQPKSKSRSSNHNSLEIRKSCRSSSSSSPVNNKDFMSQSKTVSSHKYSFSLDHDHDYCSSSPSSSSENVDTKSLENDKGPDKSTSFVNRGFDSSESIPCESVNIYKEVYFVPDAEIEIEVTESQVDTTKQTVVKATSMSSSHCKNVAGTSGLKASCSARSERNNDASKSCIQSLVETDQIESSSNPPRNFLSSPKKCLETKVSVTPTRPSTVGSVLVSDRIDDKNSYLHHSNSEDSCTSGKRRQSNCFSNPTSSSPNKKHCVWPLPNSHNFPQGMQCDEKIEDALWKRTRSPCVDNNGRPYWKNEKQKQIEERRVVYVGKLTEGMKVNDLRECFVRFGPIQDISIHFRESGDNYGFVTFFNRSDAYEVVERGKLDPKLRRFDLCFGGRRQFCRTRYSDLDSVDEGPFGRSAGDTDFDTLLQKAKAGSQNVRHHTAAS